jgi:VCBS repeat-containing protein
LANNALTDTDYSLGVTANDGTVDSAEAFATIKFDGVNDAAIITGNDTVFLGEDDSDRDPITGIFSESGKLTISDVDVGDNWTFIPSSVQANAGAFGVLTIDALGNWTYLVDTNSLQVLGGDEVVYETFTVTATDGSTKDITVKIDGHDDDPVISIIGATDIADYSTADAIEVSEDDSKIYTLDLSITDVDRTDTPAFLEETIVGEYGTAKVVDGQLIYDLSEASSVVQSLGQNDVGEETLILHTLSGEEVEVKVVVWGENDKPEIVSISQNGAITEESVTIGQVVGTVLATDIDASDILSYSITSGNEYDYFSVNSSGEITLTAAGVAAINDDAINLESVDLKVSVSDGSLSTSQSITLDITRIDNTAPDAPVITNISDDSDDSDYSTVTLHGTGEAGAVITLWVIENSTTNGNDTQTGDYTELTSVTTTVSEDGSWTLDVSNLDDVPLNDNEFFKVVQTDDAGNTSDFSNTAHYWHGTHTDLLAESADDYVLMGAGNDQITVSVDDDNDALTIDGGAGNDTVIFENFDASQAAFLVDDNGNLQITRGDTGDVVLLIGVENVKIGDTTYTMDELFTPTVSILDDLNDDGYLNGGESDGSVTVIVTLPIGAKAGDTITITSNNGEPDRVITLEATDISQGSVTVSDIAEGAEGETLSVAATLSTGTQSGSDSVVIDTEVATPTISIAGDTDNNGTYSVAELGEDGTVTATISVAGSEVGDTLTYVVEGGEAVTVSLDADDIENGVEVEVSPGDEVTVTLSDKAGNTSDEVSEKALEVNQGPVAIDDEASGIEDGGVITIDVLSNDSDADGDTLTITNATVPAGQGTVAIVDGKLEFTPAENFNGEATISYEINDGATTDTAEVTVTVSAVNDAAIINITAGDVTVTEDDVANNTASGTINISDVDTEESALESSTAMYGTVTVDGNGNWTYNLDNSNDTVQALGKGVTLTDTITFTSVDGTTQTQDITINGADESVVTIDPITDDDVLNASEASGLVTVTGTATGGNIKEGDLVKVVINAKTYETAVDADGAWSVDIEGSDLVIGTSFDAIVFSTNAAGVVGVTTATSTHTVDISATAGTVSVGVITSDNVINATESGETIPVSGTAIGGDIEAGDIVTIEVNGTEYTTKVAVDGTWTVGIAGADLAAGTEFDIEITSSDEAGNTVISSVTSTYTVDLSAQAGAVTIEPITSDDTIDGIELGETVSISGKAVGGDISVGDVVKMTINNTEYSTTVKAGGIWIIAGVLGSDLAADSEFDVVVTSNDAAGNKVESIGTSTHNVDLSAEANFSLAEGQQHVLTNLPEGFAFPNGTTEVTTNFGGKITLGEDGEYLYDAPVRDHGDAVSDKDSVTVTLDDGRTFTVNLDIQDSAPVAVNDQDSIIVRHETFEVSGVEANWISYTNGSKIKVFDGTSSNGGTDNDDGKDQIRWGDSADSAGLQSGYGFIDNDAQLDGKFDLNEDITIGTFTHYNYPVYAGGAITAASMEVAFGITDDTGASEPVTLTVNFDHNETTNTSDAEASRDIVTVQNTFVTFEWEGDVYTLQVVGFREVGNPDGEVVTSIYTDENATTSYELVVRVVEGEGYSLPETTGNVFEDNGLGADQLELSEDGGVTVVGVSNGETVSLGDTDVGQSVKGQFGNLVLEADGSYVYEVTTGVSNIPTGATETFSYMIQDSDGSTSTATLTISVGTNTAPSAQDDSSSDSLATLSEQALAISVDSLLENDTDADGDALTVTSISNVQNGYAYLNSEGVIHFTPLQGFTGVATFDYTVSDGKGGKDTATASIDVTADGVLPTVTVSVSSVSSVSSSSALSLWNGFTVEADITHEFYDYSSWVTFGNADNNVYVADDVQASLTLGTGNDKVYVGDDLKSSGNIDLGTGDDKLFVVDNVYGSIDAGTGNDDIHIGGNVDAYIGTGTGNDNLFVGGNVSKAIKTDTGNDDVYITGNVTASIETGTDNDSLFIGGDVSGAIDTSTGNDDVYIGGDVNAYVSTGTGNDTLTIKGNVGSVTVFLDTGDDFLVISGALNSKAWVDGGTGTDSIVLENYTIAQYVSNIDNIQTRVVNFENIMLSDGVVKGDPSAFNNYNSTVFTYNVSVDIDNTDSTTESSIVTLFGIPLTASLTLAGTPLDANADGSYDIEITNGQTSIEDLIVSSDIALPDLEITSLVAFDTDSSEVVGASPDEENLLGLADDSYIVGSDGIDTLLGGLGDDVLFGGDDEVTDILTGLDGKDIFILSDTVDSSNIDTITDFNAAEDALDLTDLLTGIEGSPGKDADTDLITEFLSQHVKVTDGNVKVDGEDVATFIEETSSFDSNNDGFVNGSDSIKVIYNNEEYSINIDG